MEKQLKVSEIYECIALLAGFENPENKMKSVGFCNEVNISEGTRRIANKTLKKLNDNWPKEQILAIQALEDKDLAELKEGEVREEGALFQIKKDKVDELMNNEVTIVFEELPDFKQLDKRLEERKETLSFNYTYIYDRLFLNY